MKNIDTLVDILKQRGFIYPSQEIYGGLRGVYDWGHLGILLKNKIKNLWLKEIVFDRTDVFLIESAILGLKKTYEASGHLENFNDPLVECKNCHQRFRSDHLIKGEYGKVEFREKRILCPLCKGELTQEMNFNLMFKTHVGPVEESANEAYLRPETAQGMFYNFKNILNSYRPKLPFGIAQIGKAFRNEITPKNFIFRLREFEQMELEFFVKPEDAEKWFNYWVEKRFNWYLKLGFRKENLSKYVYSKQELAHYSSGTVDIEYNFPFGFKELEGIANRTDYDLKRHSQYSKEELTYFDKERNKRVIPYVIEPSVGVERLMLAIFCEFYDEDEINGEPRRVFRFPPFLSPIEVAVFPLLTNREKLIQEAKKIYQSLREKGFLVMYDDNASIGKRYRRQDEIGTPFCITTDFQTLEDKTVTIRDRDTTKQERISIKEIEIYLRNRIKLY